MANVSATTPPAAAPKDTLVATTAGKGTGSAGQSPSFTDDLAKAAERLQPVKGHAWSKVVAGTRQGQYVNRSHNDRHGEAFEVVRRAGRVFHVYGTGDDRKVVELPTPAKAAAEAKAKADAEKAKAGTTATDTTSTDTTSTDTTPTDTTSTDTPTGSTTATGGATAGAAQ
jgi:hypothetical protein